MKYTEKPIIDDLQGVRIDNSEPRIISNEVIECARIVEQKTGKIPSDRALQLVEVAYRAGLHLADIGLQDAQNDRVPLQVSDFHGITQRIVGSVTVEDSEILDEIAKLLYANYLTGFNGQLPDSGVGAWNGQNNPTSDKERTA